MFTGVHKAKCLCCGHEFIVMEGGFNPNVRMCCPKCGGITVKSGSSSVIRRLVDIFLRKDSCVKKYHI